MKILLLSPDQTNRYNWGHQLFRNDLGRYHNVIYYGDGYSGYKANITNQIINKHNDADIILTYGLRYTIPFGQFKVPKHMKRVHILVDFFPAHSGGYKGTWNRYKNFLFSTQFDLLLVRQGCQLDYLKQINCNIPAYLFPFSVDINIYKKLNLKKIYDTITSATIRPDVYPNRKRVNKLINKMGLKNISGRIVHQQYIKSINQSKIAVISTNVFNSPNMKFTEFTACGAFVLSDRPADFNELGFKDGEHLVFYKDLKDLKNKLLYYLKHNKEREKIAEQGMNFTRKYHNNTIRIQQFTEFVNGKI